MPVTDRSKGFHDASCIRPEYRYVNLTQSALQEHVTTANFRELPGQAPSQVDSDAELPRSYAVHPRRSLKHGEKRMPDLAHLSRNRNMTITMPATATATANATEIANGTETPPVNVCRQTSRQMQTKCRPNADKSAATACRQASTQSICC